MYSDVFMRYSVKKNIGVHLCVSELYGEIKITLYCGVFRYRLTEIFCVH